MTLAELIIILVLTFAFGGVYKFVSLTFIENEYQRTRENPVKRNHITSNNLLFFILYPMMAVYMHFELSNMWQMTLTILLVGVFLSLAVIDWYVFILPNTLILFAIVLNLLIIFFLDLSWMRALLGFGFGLSIGLLIAYSGWWWYKTTAFGMGDVKILAVIGLFGGIGDSQIVFLGGIVLATGYALTGIINGKFNWKSKIPLGSFLSLSVILYILFKDSMRILW